MTKPNIYCVLPAAGVGQRAGGSLPKQYQLLLGKPMIEHTLSRFIDFTAIKKIVLAIAEYDPWWPELASSKNSAVHTVVGGAERSVSVLNALSLLAEEAGEHDWVLVHDVARPCVRPQDIDKLIKHCWAHQVGGLLAVPVSDTVKQTRLGTSVAEKTIDRSLLWQAQTPQFFPLLALKKALQSSLQAGLAITDEASAMEFAGYQPLLVESSRNNIKVTRPEDFALAEFFLQQGGY